jgi:NAD(P)-dependent dehydrogenase (short-subunit alcohol dehydrogenase family)
MTSIDSPALPGADGGPVAVVTGASSGIGAATARALARDGYDVVVHFRRDAAGAERVAEDVRAAGRHAATWRLDLGALDATGDFWGPLRAVVDGGRPVDALVLSAGVDQRGDLASFSTADIRRIFEVNAVAPLIVMQGVPDGVARGGAVVAVSSIAARAPMTISAPYSASKAALESLVASTADWLADREIRVNAVAPGAVATPMQTPERQELLRGSGILGEPEEIADVVLTLLSPATRWVTGQVLRASGPRIQP